MSERGDGDDTNQPTVDTVEIAREEAQRTIDSQIQTLNDIDNKAARILRVNLVLLGIILTGISIALNARPSQASPASVLVDFVNGYTIAGIVLLLGSTAVAAVTYTASDLRTGMSGKDLRAMLDGDYTDRQNLEGLVESYSHWIEHNFRTNARNAPLGTLTLLLLLYAMTALALGTVHAAIGHVGWTLLGVSFVLNVVLTWYTRFHRQVRRVLRLRE
ncbi:hypothetical protein MBEHAL_1990 [Halarchaeum acidiphilum MH1-52-1]|uniref:Uncharacterized protein n=1 Tax=Halarchaeum acidiphilum MH1-52-1 TaxID=1261545 RepID=U2YW26_9EURY|nr:hypothetical protein [Halarchaeum acidiphilum]GAD53230.1 hypothetical protein MBEHAL_1990 [Halarchaeum acidiphilum MH1-52-1]